MPLKPHPAFEAAPSPQSLLWRYLSLPKFLSLLQTRALYFSSLEFLASVDPFEGTLPPSRFAHRLWKSVDDVPAELRPRLHGSMPPGETDLNVGFLALRHWLEHSVRLAHVSRRSYFVNCWHLSPHESAAMWSLYSRENEGIAIVSTEARLGEALASTQKDIYGGRVNYGDYGSANFTIDDNNAFSPVLYKRESFSHEKEYRLVYWDTSVTHKQLEPVNGFYNWGGRLIPVSALPPGAAAAGVSAGRSVEEIAALRPLAGHLIPCAIDHVIERVVISPLAEKWFSAVVENACSAYGVKAVVERSRIADEPNT